MKLKSALGGIERKRLFDLTRRKVIENAEYW